MNTRIGSGRGFYINGSGYAICTKRGKNKMKKIHRMVMEEHLGRSLGRKEVIHHVDLNTSNNEISNLMLFDGTGDHMRYHAKIRREQRGEK